MLWRVTLNKKERGATITVGVTIGVILSWGLITRWQEDRDEIEKNLPGKYDSNVTAYGSPMAQPPPREIQNQFPGGRVLYHLADANASVTLPGSEPPDHIWILTTKNGSYKFVRVEQAGPGDANSTGQVSLYRGAEVFAWTRPDVSEDDFRATLPAERFNLLGENARRGCYLVQFREVSPAGLPDALRALIAKPVVAKVEPCLIE